MLALWVIFVLARGVALAVVIPPWQTPDEPGHYEFARLVSQGGADAAAQPRRQELQGEIIADLARAGFWPAVRAVTPSPLPVSFDADPFLARSGAQVGDEPVGYYWLVSRLWLAWPEADLRRQLLIGRLLSVGLLALAVLIAGGAARAVWPGDRGLGWGVPGFVALQPMAAFMGAALNNDILATLAGTAGIAAALWIVRRGVSWPRLLALVLLTLAGGWLVKKTTLFLWPLALATMFLASSHPCSGRSPTEPRSRSIRSSRSPTEPRSGRFAKSPYIIAALAAILILTVLWLAGRTADRPAAWVAGGWSGAESRIVTAEGPVLALHDSTVAQRAILEQRIVLSPGKKATGEPLLLEAEVRAASQGEPVEVSLRVTDDLHPTDAVCTAGATWTPCQLRYLPDATTNSVRVVLAVGAKGHTAALGDMHWRNVHLAWAGDSANLLANPSGAEAARRAMPLLLWLERVLQAPRGWIIALARPENFRIGALLRYAIFAVLAFAGFWGNFGWLQAPLPWPLYLWLAALCALAVWGLVKISLRGAVAPKQSFTSVEIASPTPLAMTSEKPLLLCVTAVILILAQTSLPMIGFVWQPQGRYLLPALLPIGVCLIVGLRSALPARWRSRAEIILLGTLLIANGAMFWVIATRW